MHDTSVHVLYIHTHGPPFPPSIPPSPHPSSLSSVPLTCRQCPSPPLPRKWCTSLCPTLQQQSNHSCTEQKDQSHHLPSNLVESACVIPV